MRGRHRCGRIGVLAALATGVVGCAAAAADLTVLDDYVFVASRGSSAIAVVDATVDEVVASVPLAAPADQYVVSKEARVLIASHRQARTLSLVGLDGLEPRTLELDFDPDQIELSPDGLTLAISGGGQGVVALAPLPAGRIVHRIRPGDLLYGRDGRTLFVADQGIGRIVRIDIATGTVAGQIELRDGAAPLPGIVALTRTIDGLFLALIETLETTDGDRLDYRFQVRPLTAEEGGGYVIEFPDLPGCLSDGATIEEAIANGADALRSWLDTAREFGDPIPAPSRVSDDAYSGRWNMRMPKSLHRRLAERAKAEGVSLNTLAVTLLAEGLGRRGHGDDQRAA